ncbi:MAG: molybdopterin-guanine dinucleotide biosynthesis protein B [Calditerrivibrio sp.]|nr:molybdopterin-guanine dinucleotide biosynthesis protein B [Calditerrivibrio sp.]
MKNVVSFVGASGSGKTTFVEKLIKVLTSKGIRVGAIKHDAHRFEIDKPGKDSYRFKEAGAVLSIISNREKMGLVQSHVYKEPSIEDLVIRYMQDVDIVITEGYKKSDIPKLEVLRRGNNNHPVCFDSPTLIGVISDFAVNQLKEMLTNLGHPNPEKVVFFGLDDVDGVTDFLLGNMLPFNLEIDVKGCSEMLSEVIVYNLSGLKFLKSNMTLRILVKED